MSKDQLDRIESKVDKLDSRLDTVDIRLVKYNAELEFHVARTNQIEDELLPIVKHVEQIRGAIKILAVIAAIIGFVAALRAVVE